MSNPFVAEIRMFAFNFAPVGWAFCNGQILPISQYTALFSLLGTQYGGNGTSNFALPNLQSSVPMHTTQYSGSSPFGDFFIGQQGGEESHMLISSEIPAHSHFVNADTGVANSPSASGNVYKSGQIPGAPARVVASYTTAAPNTSLNPLTIATTGSSQPHNNLMPYLTLNFCIALQGVYPARP
jgi:microcystin-dependent protein